MKLAVGTLALLSAPAAKAYTVGGFDTFGRPYLVAPRRGRNQRPLRKTGCTDRAFEDLKNELEKDRFRPRGNTPSPDYFFTMDEETIRQQEEWIKRAFGLVSDVTKGMASSQKEAKEADKAIRQSREFVEDIFGFAKDVSSGGAYTYVPSEVLQDDDKLFQVSFDVPGVKAEDLDVTVEGTRDKILVVRGKRQRGDEEARKFSKTITLDSRSDTEKLSADLENGVLLVTIPRLSLEQTEFAQKIAVNKVSDELNRDDTNAFPFKLEIDVPGVSASSIDISLEGESEKTLTVTAVRVLGKDSEGNPRTNKTSKSFKVDELVDTSKIVANLNNGVLKISAPADENKAQESVRKIAVNQGSVESTGSKLGSDDSEMEVKAGSGKGVDDDDDGKEEKV